MITARISKIICLSLSLILIFSGFCCGGNILIDANDLFVTGDYRDIEVTIPKRGFLGSVPGGFPNIPVPTLKEHFNYKHVRIKVEEKVDFKDRLRVILRLDEIDSNGVIITNSADSPFGNLQPLFYAYLNIEPENCTMTGSTGAAETLYESNTKQKLQHRKDHTGRILNGVIRNNISFPLLFTIPPALNPHKKFKDNSWISANDPIVYSDIIRLSDPNYIQINALIGRKIDPSWEIRQEDKRYYFRADKKLYKGQKGIGIEVVIDQKETQIWDAASDDWLWQSIERTDRRGNVTMRCKKLSAKIE